MLKDKKAFTLIELIVTVAVLGVLVLLGGPRLLSYTQKAELTRIQHDTKVMEQEMKLAMLDDEVSLAGWDDNAKDLGALILRDQLYEKEGFAERVDKSHLERRYGSANLANYDNESKLGVGGTEIALTSDEGDDLVGDGYKIIPEQYKSNIKTRLGGTFYTNELGKVYYEHDKPLTSQKDDFIKACESPIAEDLGYTFNYETMTIEDYDHREQHLVIPASFKNPENDECVPVKIIGEGAFMIGGYKSVIIPESVQRIEREAFLNNEFTEVNIPHSVDYVGENAFTGDYIDSVTINRKEGTVSFGNAPFYNRTTGRNITPSYRQPSAGGLGYTFDRSRGAIVSVKRPKDGVLTIPESVSIGGEEYPILQIDKGAFQGLGLISVVLPQGLERIEDYAFSGNQLVGVTIPDSVVHIGNYAFSFNEQTHSLTGEKRATIKSVIMKGEEQFNKIDQYGDILEYEGGPKVDLLSVNSVPGELALLDHIFVTSIGNHVVDEKYVGGNDEKNVEKESEPIVFSGLEPEAFDGNSRTSTSFTGTKVITWTGNLDNKELVVQTYKSFRETITISFYNEIGILVSPSYPNSSTISVADPRASGDYTTKVIVPEGATQMRIYSNHNSNKIYEISPPSVVNEVEIQEIRTSSDDKSITLNWDTPQRVIIYKNNQIIKDGVADSFLDTPLHADSLHEYSVLFMDEYGNGSQSRAVVSERVKTKPIMFRGLDPEAFDGNSRTSTSFTGTKVITWTGNLDNEELVIQSYKSFRETITISFYNEIGILVSPSYPNSSTISVADPRASGDYTTKVIVPEGATQMRIYSNHNSNKIYEISPPM